MVLALRFQQDFYRAVTRLVSPPWFGYFFAAQLAINLRTCRLVCRTNLLFSDISSIAHALL